MGINGDGVITLVLAVAMAAAVAIALFAAPSRPGMVLLDTLIMAGGAIAFVIALTDARNLARVDRGVADSALQANVGSGIYLVGLGGLVAVFAMLVATLSSLQDG